MRDPWPIPPRPRDLPGWRLALMREWGPGGVLRHIQPIVSKLRTTATGKAGQEFVADWEYDTSKRAELWLVRPNMCDLLDAAAVDMPLAPLTEDMIIDSDGLVVFETPLAGIDADGSDNVVSVGGYLWGPCVWEARPNVPALGITAYGPMPRYPWLIPLGSLVWPLGETQDCQLEGALIFPGGDLTATYVSMAEDRRRLMALWLLSSQPGLATSERKVQDRASWRQSERAGVDPNVRVVELRRTPPSDRPAGMSGRTYRHRWTVSGHWRQQACGPRWSLRRPIYINPHLAGPEDAPLLVSPKVKVWSR